MFGFTIISDRKERFSEASVSSSVNRRGVCIQGDLATGGLHPGRICLQGVCLLEWVCLQGGLLQGVCLITLPVLTFSGGHCSGR